MSYPAVAFIVLASGCVAGLFAWIARRNFKLESLRRHHEIGSAVFLQLGVIYAVLLAFVFSEVWSEYNTTASAISQECGSLKGAWVLSRGLPPAGQNSFETHLISYLYALRDEEWPAMARRAPSDVTRRAFDTLLAGVAVENATTSADTPTRSQLLAQLSAAQQWRETRLFQMVLHVPTLVWALLIGLGAVLVGFLLCFGIEYVGSQVVFTAVFAASIAFVLVLVRCLDFPFEGSMALQPDAVREILNDVIGSMRN